MKKYVLSTIVIAFGFVIMTAFSDGGATKLNMGNRTGAGGSQANCDGSGCHGPNASDLAIDLYLVDVYGDTVTNGRYHPNAVYNVKIFGRTTGSFPKFGFQFAAEKFTGFAGAGNFIPSSGLQANPIGPYEVVEHAFQPLTSSGANNFPVSFFWKAPGPGSGQVKFYVTLLAANDNGFANGDKASNIDRTYNENPASVASLSDDIHTSVFPNPASDKLNFKMSNAGNAPYELTVYTLTGQLVDRQVAATGKDEVNLQFNTSSWQSGSYVLRVTSEGKSRVIPVIKQ